MLWGRWGISASGGGWRHGWGWACVVWQRLGSGTGVKWSRKKVFHLLRELSEKLDSHVRWGRAEQFWDRAGLGSHWLCPIPEWSPFPPLGKCRERGGHDWQFWHWISVTPALWPWQWRFRGKQTGALAQGSCGKAKGGSGRRETPARAVEGGKPQQSTIFSLYCQAGFVQGQYISPLWQLWQTVQAWLVQSSAQGLTS